MSDLWTPGIEAVTPLPKGFYSGIRLSLGGYQDSTLIAMHSFAQQKGARAMLRPLWTRSLPMSTDTYGAAMLSLWDAVELAYHELPPGDAA